MPGKAGTKGKRAPSANATFPLWDPQKKWEYSESAWKTPHAIFFQAEEQTLEGPRQVIIVCDINGIKIFDAFLDETYSRHDYATLHHIECSLTTFCFLGGWSQNPYLYVLDSAATLYEVVDRHVASESLSRGVSTTTNNDPAAGRRPGGVKGGDPHQFIPKAYHKPTFCDECHFMIWRMKGYRCADCESDVHANCLKIVTSKCTGPKKGKKPRKWKVGSKKKNSRPPLPSGPSELDIHPGPDVRAKAPEHVRVTSLAQPAGRGGTQSDPIVLRDKAKQATPGLVSYQSQVLISPKHSSTFSSSSDDDKVAVGDSLKGPRRRRRKRRSRRSSQGGGGSSRTSDRQSDRQSDRPRRHRRRNTADNLPCFHDDDDGDDGFHTPPEAISGSDSASSGTSSLGLQDASPAFKEPDLLNASVRSRTILRPTNEMGGAIKKLTESCALEDLANSSPAAIRRKASTPTGHPGGKIYYGDLCITLEGYGSLALNDPSRPGIIDNPYFKGEIFVRIKNAVGAPEDPYFEGKSRLFSIFVRGKFKKEFGGDDILYGAVFSKKITAPTGTSFGMKFAKTIDPSLVADYSSDQPHFLSPLICSMNEMSGPNVDHMTSKDRRSHFAKLANRQQYTYEPGKEYTFEIYGSVMDWNTFDVNLGPLGVNAFRFLHQQPVIMQAATRTGEVIWSTPFDHRKAYTFNS